MRNINIKMELQPLMNVTWPHVDTSKHLDLSLGRELNSVSLFHQQQPYHIKP